MASVFARWKYAGLLVLLALAMPAAIVRSAEATDVDPLRQQAVSQYIEGATKELAAFDRQITDTARPNNQQQCGEARAKLDECARLLATLKTSDAEHFDLVKASYERARGDLVKALQAAQGN
ncbi:MAG TPA: hypothetical protein VFE25_02385 [Opitutaceae bacterium]|jgi:hypothetical protein|nr:hypothetical protein [Opitutaceae bacterium]